MNDPGLEAPIADAEKQGTQGGGTQRDILRQEQEEEDLLLAPRLVAMATFLSDVMVRSYLHE